MMRLREAIRKLDRGFPRGAAEGFEVGWSTYWEPSENVWICRGRRGAPDGPGFSFVVFDETRRKAILRGGGMANVAGYL